MSKVVYVSQLLGTNMLRPNMGGWATLTEKVSEAYEELRKEVETTYADEIRLLKAQRAKAACMKELRDTVDNSLYTRGVSDDDIPNDPTWKVFNGLFKKAVKDCKETTAMLDEASTIVVDFKGVSIISNNTVGADADSMLARKLCEIPNIRIELYNEEEMCYELQMVAKLCKKKSGTDTVIHNNIVEVHSDTVAPLSAKEKAAKKQDDAFKKFLESRDFSSDTLIVEFKDFLRPEFENPVGNLQQPITAHRFINIIKDKVLEDNGIRKMVLDFDGYNTSNAVLNLFAAERKWFNEQLIDYSIIAGASNICADQEKLELFMMPEIDDDAKIKLFDRLGKGCVGILSRFKDSRGENKRLENEVYNQWIAVYKGVVKPKEENMPATKARFDCFELQSFRDNSADKFAREYSESENELKRETKEIELSAIGVERSCRGKLWHFNIFHPEDDYSASGKWSKTYIDENGEFNPIYDENTGFFKADSIHEESVVYPEFVRRVMLYNGIQFDNEMLKRNAQTFKNMLDK